MKDQDRSQSVSPEKILERAYALKTPGEAKALYADWAMSYDQHLEQGLNYIAPACIAQTLVNVLADRTASILDIGCGTGLVGAYLVGQGYSAIDGLDFSSEMLSQARSKRIYQKLLSGDLNTVLDIPDQTYDAGISCGTFTHGHVKADALDEIIRVLKPGACFVCTIHREVWQSAGFGTKFAQLMASGVAELESMNEQPFYRNAPDDGRFCVVRRL
mgnify:FL=1|tara:strand:+ start:10316 stop:10963 length:648 start_codon:yes stop_codon:yes gene_type:complete